MPGKSTVHAEFYAHVATLKGAAAAAGLAVTAGGQRAWAAPPPSAWAGDPADVAGMTAAFDRTAIGQEFASVYSDATTPGTVGDVVALKLQSDYVAGRERAFRTRHASAVRSAAHAAARRRGHGHDAGVYVNGVLRYAQDLVRQARTG